MAASRITEIMERNESALLNDWLRLQTEKLGSRRERTNEPQLRGNSRDFLVALREVPGNWKGSDIAGPEWKRVRDLLEDLSRQRMTQGYSPSETAMFVMSFKQALFQRLREEFADDPQALAEETWTASEALDKLGLFTTEVHQKAREEVISRQQQDVLELSTPVVELWQGILAIPLIGTLDSNRTQVVMQSLLEAIIAKSAEIAIIDITGVPTVDTMVAQHLLRTVAATRLMGAECIISGIRPQIAQTIIHLGVDLGSVITKATLADAFQIALRRRNLSIVNVK